MNEQSLDQTAKGDEKSGSKGDGTQKAARMDEKSDAKGNKQTASEKKDMAKEDVVDKELLQVTVCSIFFFSFKIFILEFIRA